MTETQQASAIMFSLWLGTLDAVKIAAQESFHSEAHRFAMTAHEAQKQLLERAVSKRSKTAKITRDANQLAEIQINRIINQIKQKRETA